MNPEYKNLTKIPYFRRVVLQNFPFIEEDFDALTDYAFLCKVVEYLNKVIEQQNLVNDNTDALHQAYIELKNYVENYFTNLDVQEEINNKLDAMAENGDLQEIVDIYFRNNKKDIIYVEAFTNIYDGSVDTTEAFNNAIIYALKNNCKDVGCKNNHIFRIDSSILLPNGINLLLGGSTIRGIGDNALILSARYDSENDILIPTTDKNTIETTYPYLITCNIEDGIFENAYVAIKLNALTYGSVIKNCKFNRNLTNSIILTNSWGSSLIGNYFNSPVILKRYCDWFSIISNSFERSDDDNGLIVGDGSYSMRIMSNGFHHLRNAIKLEGLIRDCVISSNHFEANGYAILSDNNNKYNLKINNNFIKGGQNAVDDFGYCYGLYFYTLINSEIKLNHFQIDTNDTEFNERIHCAGSSNNNIIKYYNQNTYENSSDYAVPNMNLYNVRNSKINIDFGIVNESKNQPSYLDIDKNGFTYEKYISKYNISTHKIPFTQIDNTSVDKQVTIITSIDYNTSDGHAVQPALCWLQFAASGVKKSYILLINGKNIEILNYSKLASWDIDNYEPTFSLTNINGKVGIVASGFYNTPTTDGFIKEL